MNVMTKKQMFTDEEYEKITLMAVSGKPQSEDQLCAVIKEAETMRATSLILESVLAGLLCMYDDGGEIMFSKAKE